MPAPPHYGIMPDAAYNYRSSPDDQRISQRYAARILASLGAAAPEQAVTAAIHPARRWAESGLMSLTCADAQTPRMCPVPLASCADAALDAFRWLVGENVFPNSTGADLLVERATITGFQGNGSGSLAGHCRILQCRDGMLALSLTREEDWDLLPSWFEADTVSDWPSVEAHVKVIGTEALISRGKLLGLAVADARKIPGSSGAWMRVAYSNNAAVRPHTLPRVIDLSSLWAGPLCSSLWQAAGARVTKVESSQRPDGARHGPAEFFALLNRGKRSVALDLHRKPGRQALLELIKQADIVLEGSRPRALRQMGIFAEELIDEKPGLTWVSITGYGRREPQANWIAYGDDAGIAAGLSAIMHQVTGDWLICGDAVADPLTALHAALAGWASWSSGGGKLIDLSLEQTVRHCITATAPSDEDYVGRQARWQQYLEDHHIAPLAPCRLREVATSEH